MFRTLLIGTIIVGLQACASAPPPQANASAPRNPYCVSSGSRIQGPCANVVGRSYTEEELDRTGHTNVGEALQQLDPTVTIAHH